MRKNQTTQMMVDRFGKIDAFVFKNKRTPTNREVAEMFELSVGSATKHVLDLYKNSKNKCPLCKREWL